MSALRWNILSIYAYIVCLVALLFGGISGVQIVQSSLKLALPSYLEASIGGIEQYSDNAIYRSTICQGAEEDKAVCAADPSHEAELTRKRENALRVQLSGARAQNLNDVFDNIPLLIFAVILFATHWRIGRRAQLQP